MWSEPWSLGLRTIVISHYQELRSSSQFWTHALDTDVSLAMSVSFLVWYWILWSQINSCSNDTLLFKNYWLNHGGKQGACCFRYHNVSLRQFNDDIGKIWNRSWSWSLSRVISFEMLVLCTIHWLQQLIIVDICICKTLHRQLLRLQVVINLKLICIVVSYNSMRFWILHNNDAQVNRRFLLVLISCTRMHSLLSNVALFTFFKEVLYFTISFLSWSYSFVRFTTKMCHFCKLCMPRAIKS